MVRRPIEDVCSRSCSSTQLDVIAIVKEVGPIGEVVSKASNKSVRVTPWVILSSKHRLQVAKRDLTIVDKSLYSVRMTIWGRQAETFAADDFPVVAFKGVKVGDFGGTPVTLFIIFAKSQAQDETFPCCPRAT